VIARSQLPAKPRTTKPTAQWSEDALIARWQRTHDREAMAEIARRFLPLVAKLARPFARAGLAYEDLVQEGMLGLMTAVDRFERDRGLKLVTYAQYWVRAYLGASVARERGVTRKGDVKRLRPRRLSLDAPISSEGVSTTRLELLRDRAETVEDAVADAELSERVRAAVRMIGKLDARERLLVTMRLMPEGDEASLADIGRRVGVCRERMRQIEVDLKARLRPVLESLAG
jgi:RNA polymerase sigma factor (sigma-70 family)